MIKTEPMRLVKLDDQELDVQEVAALLEWGFKVEVPGRG